MSAWGTAGPSAWASQVDEEEQSGGQLGPTAPAAAVFGGAVESFPSLAEVGKVSKKDKRQKGRAVSLAEFQGGSSAARGTGTFVPSAARQQRPADDPTTNLPTGPRERGDDEESRKGGLGGGFKGGYGRDRDDDDAGFSAAREDDGPSKADMSDNWGADRKFVAADRPSGGGGFSSSRSLDPSRADDSRSWGRDRPATADDSSGSRPSSRGGGFEEREDIGPSRADTDDRWGSKGSASFSREPPARSDSGTWGASRRSSSPPPATGSRPKLALKPRTLPAPELPVPKSTASSESGTSIAEPESLSMPAPSQPTKRSNPFGAARPREDVLKEQGRDHTKEEAALAQRAADRPETEEEAALKESILQLRAQLEAGDGEQKAATSVQPAEHRTGGAERSDTPLPNGTSTSEPSVAEALESDQPGSAARAGVAEQSENVVESLEKLEAELAKLVIENNDKARYQRTSSSRW